MTLKRTNRVLWLAAALITAPRAALACPVCFGDVSSPMAGAANTAIIVMLIVVGCVLTAFASFFICLARRARLAAGEPGPAGTERHLLPVSNPHEGGVRC